MQGRVSGQPLRAMNLLEQNWQLISPFGVGGIDQGPGQDEGH